MFTYYYIKKKKKNVVYVFFIIIQNIMSVIYSKDSTPL